MSTTLLNIHTLGDPTSTFKFHYIRVGVNPSEVSEYPVEMVGPDGNEYWCFSIDNDQGLALLALVCPDWQYAVQLLLKYESGIMIELGQCPYCSEYTPQNEHCDQCGQKIPYLLTHDADLIEEENWQEDWSIELV